MAYATTNPPLLSGAQPIAGARWWVYKSTHTQLEVGTSDFISDGDARGMKVGDGVSVHGSTTFLISIHGVRAVGTTFTSLSAGHLVSSAS